MKLRKLLVAVALLAAPAILMGATLPNPFLTGPQDPSQLQANINQLALAVNGNASGWVNQNYLDNGDFFVAQRGTADTTGGTTSGCAVASYPVDRWCVDTNVGSGTGHGQVITSTPSPPPGFQNSVKIWRNANALTQPILLMQEIESAKSTQLAGKPVIASCYVQPLAGLTSTGGAVNMYIFTGTGADQGLGALRGAAGMTASPALTPAWTTIASNTLTAGAGSPSFSLGTTAAWSRIYSTPLSIPSGTTEVAFAIGFTPVGSSSGATDGIAVAGCQLEQVDVAQTTPSPFQFLPPQVNLARAQRFFWQIADPAATVEIPSACFVTAANTTVKCGVWLPTQMQTTPVTAISTSTSFGIVVTAGTAGTCTTLAATGSSNSVNSIGVTCTTGGTIALGSATPLIGAATAGTLNASADF